MDSEVSEKQNNGNTVGENHETDRTEHHGNGARHLDLPDEEQLGTGWSIPDGDTSGSTNKDEVNVSTEGSQKCMFTDSDGGSTVKMAEQSHSDSTQTDDDGNQHSNVKVTDADEIQEVNVIPRQSTPSPQKDVANQEISHFIEHNLPSELKDEPPESREISISSDVVNNNVVVINGHADQPRSSDPVKQNGFGPSQVGSESVNSAQKQLSGVGSSGSLFSEEGYQTFPGADQSMEVMNREVYGKEDDDSDTVKANSSSCTDTSNLAQIIVDHVLENVVGTLKDDDDDSVSSSQDFHDQAAQVFNRAEIQNVEESRLIIQRDRLESDEKKYASKTNLGSEVDSAGEMTDFQLNVNEQDIVQLEDSHKASAEGDQNQEKRTEQEDAQHDEVAEKQPSSENSVLDMSDTECGSMGFFQKLDPLPNHPDFPENYGNYKVCREVNKGVKECLILDSGEQFTCIKSKDSGISLTVSSDRGGHGHQNLAVSGGEEAVQDVPKQLTESPEPSPRDGMQRNIPENVLTDSIQEYDTQRLTVASREDTAEKPYEESSASFKELTPQNLTNENIENSLSDDSRTCKPKSNITKTPLKNDGMAYNTVSAEEYNEPSTIDIDQSTNQRENLEKSLDHSSSIQDGNGFSLQNIVQTPPKMVLREKREFASEDIITEKTPVDHKQEAILQNHREAEMLREQMILEKVRKDMAAKEKEMREQMEREMQERMDKARQEQEKVYSSREFYRSENDLSQSAQSTSRSFELEKDGNTELTLSPQRMSSCRRSPTETGSSDFSLRASSELDTADRDIIQRYQEELSRSELNQQKQFENSGIDTYATLQKPHILHEPSSSREKQHQTRMEGMSYADISAADRAALSSIYSSYNIPPPHYNVSTSFTAQSYNSSRTSSELEAPPPKSGSVPPFKTLHEQQMGWMRMFQTLEEQHHNELKNQYRQHQETIFSMQQQMENELFNQSQQLRQKLAAHKQALTTSVSPIRSQGDRDPGELASTSIMVENTHTSSEDHSGQIYLSQELSHSSQRSHPSEGHARDSLPWKDIYREIRGKGIDSDRETVDTEEEESTPVRRSLEDDFLSKSSLLRQPLPDSINASPRTKYDVSSNSLPRGGVYSSPMPILRKSNQSQSSPLLNKSPRQADRDVSFRPTCREGMSESVRGTETVAEIPLESISSDDVYSSSSHRVNLREKHAKHLSDLREYYEQEMQELRAALSRSDDITNRTPFKRVANENQALITENHILKNSNEELESQLEKALRENRELEQIKHGLERRASEYADHYKEAQEKISSFRSRVEELQYQTRTQEDTINQLEYKVKNQEDAIKHYKKLQAEQMEVVQKDRNAFHKLADKYETMERDYNILKESLNSTENKLYDARSEVVELNRTVSKLELENKRIGRENDNLRYKLTQNANAVNVSLQENSEESYGSPGRLRHVSLHDRTPASSDSTTSRNREPSPTRALRERERSLERANLSSTTRREPSQERRPRNVCNTYEEVELNESLSRHNSAPTAEETPEKLSSTRSLGVDQTSPVLRAERELYRLREIMRQADKAVEVSSPMQPKLQKKFYGSEIVSTGKKSDSLKSASPKLRKKHSPVSSPTKSQKTKLYEKPSRYSDSEAKLVPSNRTHEINSVESNNCTRFDVSVKEDKKSRSASKRQSNDNLPTRDPDSRSRQSSSSRDKRNSELKSSSNSSKLNGELKPNSKRSEKGTSTPNGSVESTLDKVRSGEYVARPEWEDIYTSMAKPRSQVKPTATPVRQTVKERLDNISEMEHRYDNLQTEKRKLEASLSRVPSHGKGRQEKENLEDKLDQVEKELGSVRMSLKRYHVLKTSI